MGVKVAVRGDGPEWPKKIGPEAHEVFREFIEMMDDIPWFLMGRSLLAFTLLGKLDEDDSDIDVAVFAEDEQRIRERFTGWGYVQHTYTDRTQQLFYQPRGVLVDLHFFSEIPEHLGYVNQFNKWVTRPAKRFNVRTRDSDLYGEVNVPYRHESFLHDDYGPNWRKKYQ